jgi:type II secretory pathway pseudopilin PulG
MLFEVAATAATAALVAATPAVQVAARATANAATRAAAHAATRAASRSNRNGRKTATGKARIPPIFCLTTSIELSSTLIRPPGSTVPIAKVPKPNLTGKSEGCEVVLRF